MSEFAKTLSYAGVAVAVLFGAWLTRPKPPHVDATAQTVKVLNPIEDPLTAARLEVIEFNEATAKIRTFEVARVNGRWSIPSHQDYPADAQDHMAQAAVSVMNLSILGDEPVSTAPAHHATYGVIDPDINTLKPGTTGVGTRVTMKDSKGTKLVNMVIGKEVKDQKGQRYVREVGKDPVYVVKLDTSHLSTTFGDWIEKDLLKLNSFDIRNVRLNDYSVGKRLTPQGLGIVQNVRSEITLNYDDTKSQWAVKELRAFDAAKGETVAVEVAEDEELDQAKLNELKTALDDLKIVDVERKPKGLSADLKAAQGFTANREAVESLMERGFIPVQAGDAVEILSSEGEVVCTMKDGVEYLLRFGEIALGETDQGKPKEDGQESNAKSGVNRYLFVTARFNEDALEKPVLRELPELPAEEGTQSKEKEKPADEAKQPPSAPEKKPEPSKDQGAASNEDAEEGAAQDDPPAKKPEAAAQPEEKKPAEKKADATAAAKEPADGAKPEGDKKAAGDSADAKKKQVEAIRKTIEAENKRKQDDYDVKVTKAKDRVKELNDRFGDWYYVISDEVYRKIHLGRKDIFKAKADAKKEGDAVKTEGDDLGAGALEKIEKEGLPGGKTPPKQDTKPAAKQDAKKDTQPAPKQNGKPAPKKAPQPKG